MCWNAIANPSQILSTFDASVLVVLKLFYGEELGDGRPKVMVAPTLTGNLGNGLALTKYRRLISQRQR